MKNCYEQAIDIIKNNNPSIADALVLAPQSVREEASILAAAFFSSTFRDTCIAQLHLTAEQSKAWFQTPTVDYNKIQTVEELQSFFNSSSTHISSALNYVLNKSSQPNITKIIEDVVVAISITQWINQLGQHPDRFTLLPIALIEEFGLDVDAIIQERKVPESLARALAVLMGEARQSFVRLYHQLTAFDPALRLGVYTAAKFHEALLDEIVWAKFELFSSVQEVSPLRRKFITFKAKRFVRKLR